MVTIPRGRCVASLLDGPGLRQPEDSVGLERVGPCLSVPLGRWPDWSLVSRAGMDDQYEPSPLPDRDPLWRRSGLSKDCCGVFIH